jgi:alpha-L-fucosidase 2
MMWSLAVLSLCSLQGASGTPPYAEHGLHFDTPVTVWDEALPLGNGLLGALVWGDGKPLRISLNRTDLWDLRPVPEFHSEEYTYATMRQWEKEGRFDDLKRVYELPYRRPAPTKIPAGRLEIVFEKPPAFKKTDLDLASATASMDFADGTAAQVWMHAEEPLGVVEIQSKSAVRFDLVAPAFGGKEAGPGKASIVAGEVAQLGYPDSVKSSGEQFSAYEQEGWDGFRFAIYVAWRRSGDTTRAMWSVASSFETKGSPLELAKKRVEKAIDGDLAASRQRHLDWWTAFWAKTWLRVPNARVERQWYLDTYKLGAAARADTPPITLQGPWTADDGKLPPWKGDYHHDANTEMSYWPCYSGNRMEEADGFVEWLWDTREACVDWTRRFFEMPGMAVPMTTDLNCEQIGGWRQYTHSATTGAWLAQHFYLHWKYSADPEFLKNRAYPYLRDCSVFIEAVTAEKDGAGKRTLPLSSAPEFNDNKPNAWFPTITNHDLGLIRWLLGATAELADALGNDADAKHWRQVLSEMPELSLGKDGNLLVAKGFPLPASHRHFAQLMPIHPLGIVDWANGEEDRRIIRASLAELDRHGSSLWVGFSFAWQASMAARARDGAAAEKALDIFAEAFVLRNSFNCNGDQSGKGYSNFTYRPFTLEANFAAAAGLQEMLLQSHTGVVEVFPAIPEGWADVSFHDLRAEGAFLISAEKKDGEIVALTARAERVGTLRIRSSQSGEIRSITLKAGEEVQILK